MNKSYLLKLFFLLPCMAFFFSCNPDEDPFSTGEDRDNYLGSWRVQETGKKKITYEVEISIDPDNSSQVLIDNFYNFGIKPYAIVTASTITMPSQGFTKSLQVYGSGSLSGDKITWTYYVNNGADLDTIQSVYTRL